MGAVAHHAGISRQGLYLHFPDRGSLYLAVSRAADTDARTPERQDRIDHAPTARDALRAAVAVQAEIKPVLRGFATAVDAMRRVEPSAQAAWEEREHARLARCAAVISRADEEGELHPRWNRDAATTLFWAVTSQRVWDDLVVDQGWSQDRYRDQLTQLLESALLR